MPELLFWAQLYNYIVLVGSIIIFMILIVRFYSCNVEEEEIEEHDVTESGHVPLKFLNLDEMKENPCYTVMTS